jgi:hypothetical protein
MSRRVIAWADEGRAIIAATADAFVLRSLEAWADIIRAEARRARWEAPAPKEPEPVEDGPALSALECAKESGWRVGQVPRRGYSPRWFYEHAAELPFALRRRGRVLRFSAAGFRRWLASRG